jgi:hypothetical protein
MAILLFYSMEDSLTCCLRADVVYLYRSPCSTAIADSLAVLTEGIEITIYIKD